MFMEANIEVVKEKGDTSQVNQSYDHSVAKQDKGHTCTALENCGTIWIMNQEMIFAACIHALGNISQKRMGIIIHKHQPASTSQN